VNLVVAAHLVHDLTKIKLMCKQLRDYLHVIQAHSNLQSGVSLLPIHN
jgi:hypothetical protein